VSEGNPLDHLAFHIHIDNHSFIRNPNFLEILGEQKDDDEQEQQEKVADEHEEVLPQNQEDEEDDKSDKNKQKWMTTTNKTRHLNVLYNMNVPKCKNKIKSEQCSNN
jgi:alkylhydroperoxidase/carboxymuconolactone decarboxylase family protein YurZ